MDVMLFLLIPTFGISLLEQRPTKLIKALIALTAGILDSYVNAVKITTRVRYIRDNRINKKIRCPRQFDNSHIQK
jgi:hypothetical protein